MNSTKLLLGTLAGFVGYFMGGFVMYTIVFKDALASAMPNMASAQAEPKMEVLVFGNLVAAFLIALIFERWANIRTLGTGAIYGGLIGFLIAVSFDSMIHGTSNLMSWGGVFLDGIVYGIISAIAGALIGFTLGYKRK
jgi:phosphotransferase system  glucose/maltose/N-acetylglucosamine-specific IIC component